MATAVFGRKKHMTQAFQDDGTLVSVTVIEVEPNFVTAVRSKDEDGYEAVQVGFGVVPTRKVNKPHAGQFEKHETPPRRHLKELRGVSGEVGSTIGVDAFAEGDKVHVTAVSKGKGFQGTVKRRGFGRSLEGLPRAADARTDGRQGRHDKELEGRCRGRREERAVGARRSTRR